MAVIAAYAPPLRASIWPATLKRTMAAKSVYAPAAPAASPMTPSMAAPFGVPSNCTVKDPVCGANALFSHTAALCRPSRWSEGVRGRRLVHDARSAGPVEGRAGRSTVKLHRERPGLWGKRTVQPHGRTLLADWLRGGQQEPGGATNGLVWRAGEHRRRKTEYSVSHQGQALGELVLERHDPISSESAECCCQRDLSVVVDRLTAKGWPLRSGSWSPARTGCRPSAGPAPRSSRLPHPRTAARPRSRPWSPCSSHRPGP